MYLAVEMTYMNWCLLLLKVTPVTSVRPPCPTAPVSMELVD